MVEVLEVGGLSLCEVNGCLGNSRKFRWKSTGECGNLGGVDRNWLWKVNSIDGSWWKLPLSTNNSSSGHFRVLPWKEVKSTLNPASMVAKKNFHRRGVFFVRFHGKKYN